LFLSIYIFYWQKISSKIDIDQGECFDNFVDKDKQVI